MKRETLEGIAIVLFNTAVILMFGASAPEDNVSAAYTIASLTMAILGVIALMAIDPKDTRKGKKNASAK